MNNNNDDDDDNNNNKHNETNIKNDIPFLPHPTQFPQLLIVNDIFDKNWHTTHAHTHKIKTTSQNNNNCNLSTFSPSVKLFFNFYTFSLPLSFSFHFPFFCFLHVTGVCLFAAHRGEWKFKSASFVANTTSLTTAAGHITLAGYANRCECINVCDTIHFQCATGVLSILVDLFNYGCSIFRWEILQMHRWWWRISRCNGM